MVLPPKAAPPRQCPRCAGALYQGCDGDYCCLCCGECIYLDVPSVRVEILAVPSESRPRKRGRPRRVPAAA
jgi:hypothetical protein